MRAEPRMLAVVPARGGSKGIPGKNIRPLGGKPLIAYTIDAARESGCFGDVVVTTDDEQIRQIAIAHGATAPFLRPAELSTDTALAVPTIQHAVREMEALTGLPYDVIAMLQPTTPFRTAQDLRAGLGRLVETGADGVISIVNVGNWHPIKMKRLSGDYLVDYQTWPVENPPRQSLPPVYMVNGALYASRRDVLLGGSFRGDRCVGYEMPEARSVNIDTEADFFLAEHYWLPRLANG